MNGCGLLESIHARAYDACIPLHVSLELTLRCNIRCTHCYNFDREVPRPASGAELSIREIRDLLDDLRRSGTLFLSLTGGEAMLHPRFWEISDLAAERGFAVTVLSNGTLLSEEACDRLAKYPNLWGVSLSVYGASAPTHDAITRSEGSHRRTLDGARRLAARGVRVGLKFGILKSNAAEASRMIELAEQEGFEYSIDPTVTGRYDGTGGSLGERVDPPALEELYRGPLRPLIRPGSAHPTDDEWKCNCARGNAAVGATGQVYPCIAAPLAAGSIREHRFGEIWAGAPLFQWIRGLRLADFKTCAPCSLKPWCRHSPGPALLASGDYAGVDPWTCQEAAVIRAASTSPGA